MRILNILYENDTHDDEFELAMTQSRKKGDIGESLASALRLFKVLEYRRGKSIRLLNDLIRGIVPGECVDLVKRRGVEYYPAVVSIAYTTATRPQTLYLVKTDDNINTYKRVKRAAHWIALHTTLAGKLKSKIRRLEDEVARRGSGYLPLFSLTGQYIKRKRRVR